MVLEAASSGMIPKVMSHKMSKSYFSAGFISGLMDCISRGLGNVLVTVFSKIEGIHALPFYLYLFNIICGIIVWVIGIAIRKKLQRFEYFRIIK
jgi:hypothetical protein